MKATGDVLARFEHVTKSFGSKVIYEDLTLDVKKGETLVVLGGSGTGKSVMLKLLIGLLKPDSGDIFVNEENIVGYDEHDLLHIRKSISMLFQGGALFDSLTVFENVAYPLREHLTLDEAALAERVSRSLDLVGLSGSEALKPADLSGGMRKRAALARSIVLEPEVILYDEPTTGLDPANTRRISDLIQSLQEKLGLTSIVVTHDMPCAFHVADRIAMLHDFRIHVADTPAALMKSTDPVVSEFIHAMEMPAMETFK
jgi:phospholipid/cholesterol/gamma-HCH transport system ATP-binding protein